MGGIGSGRCIRSLLPSRPLRERPAVVGGGRWKPVAASLAPWTDVQRGARRGSWLRTLPKHARLAIPRAWAGFFFAQGRPQLRRDFRSWPAETFALLSPSPARSASIATTKQTRASATTPIG